jgi:hypothetical protein
VNKRGFEVEVEKLNAAGSARPGFNSVGNQGKTRFESSQVRHGAFKNSLAFIRFHPYSDQNLLGHVGLIGARYATSAF